MRFCLRCCSLLLGLITIPGSRSSQDFTVSWKIRRGSSLAFAAAGGGFGGGGAERTNKGKTAKGKRGGLATELEVPKTNKESLSQQLRQDKEPALDKWGLPVPTEDDLFPPMPPGTELIPIQSKDTTISLDEIRSSLKDHLELNLNRFDNNGIEKSHSPGNKPMKLRLLHQSPPVLAIENFFTDQECEEARAVTEKDAMQIGSKTFSPLSQSKRTSTSWFCHYQDMPALLSKAHHVLGIPYRQMEEPQVVRYRTGEEFTWHYDEVPPTQLDNGGQRVATLLVYLRSVAKGGGTIFRDLQAPDGGSRLTMKPVKGSALLFFPAYRDGTPDDRSLHKGEVAEDEKWITQMWIHEREYRPVVPPGNSHEAAEKAVAEVSAALGYI